MSGPDHSSQHVNIENLSKSFGGVKAVDHVSLTIGQGEFFSLLGASGCGKTTLMRMIAGFESPDSGTILLGGHDLAKLAPHQRPINMMFQNYALFPHMSVEANIAFGLKQQGRDAAFIKERTARMMELVQLDGLGSRKPEELSGGQRQRVALARALARAPKLLLLDEPLAALDKKLRKETQAELKRIQKESGATFIVVTHDQEEAMALSDRIAIMRAGRVEQIGAPADVYVHPANAYVAGFMGDANLWPVIVSGVQGQTVAVKLDGLPQPVISAVSSPRIFESGQTATVCIRPERLSLSARKDKTCDHWLQGRVTERIDFGSSIACRFMDDSMRSWQVLIPVGNTVVKTGSTVWLGFRSADLRLLEASI